MTRAENQGFSNVRNIMSHLIGLRLDIEQHAAGKWRALHHADVQQGDEPTTSSPT